MKELIQFVLHMGFWMIVVAGCYALAFLLFKGFNALRKPPRQITPADVRRALSPQPDRPRLHEPFLHRNKVANGK